MPISMRSAKRMNGNNDQCPSLIREKAPSGTSLLVAFEFLGIKEKRVEEVAAVATQVVIKSNAGDNVPGYKCRGGSGITENADTSNNSNDGCQIAYNRQSVFGRFIISMYDLPDDSGSRAKQCNAYHTE